MNPLSLRSLFQAERLSPKLFFSLSICLFALVSRAQDSGSPLVLNDHFEDRLPITPLEPVTGHNQGSTLEENEPRVFLAPTSSSVWWSVSVLRTPSFSRAVSERSSIDGS